MTLGQVVAPVAKCKVERLVVGADAGIRGGGFASEFRSYLMHALTHWRGWLKKATRGPGIGKCAERLAHVRVAGMARLRVSIVFDSGARIGPGKAKLLESIRDTGSISAAARDIGMSYKRAWVLLDSINRAFTEPVVTAAPGGAGGGGASLTPFGAEVLEHYNRILDQAATNAVGDLAALAGRARPRGRRSKTLAMAKMP